MKSYAEREIFSSLAMSIWCDAVDIVKRIASTWGNELRCHELARAALDALRALNLRKLDEIDAKLYLVDGRLWSIDHSWLVYEWRDRLGRRRFILDVYCPGRLPQVQLLDGDHFVIARGYEPGETRTDIDYAIVRQLTREMST